MSLPVVLLHGQPGGPGDWDPVLPHLDGLRVLTPTRPGYDGSPAGGFGVNAAAVLRLLDREGIDRAVLVGHSWAGGIALRLALDAPERVASLGLLGSVGSRRAVGWSDRLLAAPVLRGTASRAADRVGVRAARLTELASGSRLAPAAREALRRQTAQLTGQDWKAFATEQRALVREAPALDRELERIVVPAVVAVGRRDAIVSRRAQRDLFERLPNAELVEHPGGHLVQLESPELVADVVRRAVSLGTSDRP